MVDGIWRGSSDSYLCPDWVGCILDAERGA
jgi:hypothetical protein